MRAFPVLALVVFALSACAGAGWRKDGVSDEDRAHDLATCRQQARAATQRDLDIDQDITATRSLDWQRTGVFRTKEDEMRHVTGSRASDIVERCMQSKGYSQG
jgi:hypothetical protein